MKNLNRLRLEVIDAVINSSGSVNGKVFTNHDRVVNDISRSIEICAIKTTASFSRSTSDNLNVSTLLKLALGLTNKYDPKTNIFEWMFYYQSAVTALNAPDSITTINETLGNFKDVLFELQPFSAEVRDGNAAKGEIHLNSVLDTLFGVTKDFFLNCVIIIYYK